MSLKNVVVGALAIGIAFASLDLGTTVASAATAAKKPHHHMLVCKKGFVAAKVKVHGKWVWHCHRVHHKHHVTAPKMPANTPPPKATPMAAPKK